MAGAGKKFFAIFAGLAFLGCVTADENFFTSGPIEEVNLNLKRRFLSLRQVSKGMSPQEVESVLGRETVIGYELIQEEHYNQYKPITVISLQRTETVDKGSQSYRVDYYLAGIKDSDDQISDEELVPLVFLDDRLIGSGWAFLNGRIKK